MKQINVTYCAIFRQPIGKLNPAGLRMNVECPVELFCKGDKWRLREISSPKRVVYEKLGEFSSAAQGKEITEASFESQVEGWQMWTKRDGANVQLSPEEVAELPDGKIALKELEDYTHIIHAPQLNAKERIPRAACGASVDTKCFINNRANVEPTCRGCADVWKREYQGR